MIEIFSCVLLLFGALFCFTSALGCLRFKGFLNKMHSASIGDNLGCPLMLVAIAMKSDSYISATKIIILAIIILIVSPTSSYILNLYVLRKKLKSKKS